MSEKHNKGNSISSSNKERTITLETKVDIINKHVSGEKFANTVIHR